ncbi:hypothetical protein QN239_22380 [Mycolicibacterium sp. Y3]
MDGSTLRNRGMMPRSVVAAIAVAGALTGCGSSSAPAPESAPGCLPVTGSQWASAPDTAGHPVHVELPQPPGWSASPELAGQLVAALTEAGGAPAPVSVLALVGPEIGESAPTPTVVASVFDITATRGASAPQDYLATEIKDYADAIAAGGGSRLDAQSATTLCGYPARSYVTHRPPGPLQPRPGVTFDIRAVVPAEGRSYEVQVGLSPHDSTAAVLRTDFATILAGIRVITRGAD